MQTRPLIEIVRGLAQHPEGFAGLFRRMSYVPLLPLLELPRLEVADGLREAFRDSGLSDAEFERVSLRDLVVFALRSESDYWAGLSVRWLADGFPIDEAVVRAGDEMVAAKRGTQADRHTLFRLIRRYEPCA
jgi:hypothetical protein